MVPNHYDDMLKQLTPYFFTYKSSGAKGFGLIAEELDKLGYRTAKDSWKVRY